MVAAAAPPAAATTAVVLLTCDAMSQTVPLNWVRVGQRRRGRKFIKKGRYPLSGVQKELADEEGPQVLSGCLFWVLPLASSPSSRPCSMELASFFFINTCSNELVLQVYLY